MARPEFAQLWRQRDMRGADDEGGTMRQRGKPLLRDARRTRAWPVLATCVIVLALLGLLLREEARPDRLDAVVDTAMVASFRGHQSVLPWLALPGRLSRLWWSA